jgi:hypothetical protein
LRSQIVENLLLHVVFGKLSARDVRYFLHTESSHLSTDEGLNLRLLHYLRQRDFISLRSTAANFDTTPARIRERMQVLRGAEFIEPKSASFFLTEKGQVFLELVDRLAEESRAGSFSYELYYFFDRIGCPLTDAVHAARRTMVDGIRYIPPVLSLFAQMIFGQRDVPWWTLGLGIREIAGEELAEQ